MPSVLLPSKDDIEKKLLYRRERRERRELQRAACAEVLCVLCVLCGKAFLRKYDREYGVSGEHAPRTVPTGRHNERRVLRPKILIDVPAERESASEPRRP